MRSEKTSLDIGQLNALLVFAVKRITIPEISKELPNGTFGEYDRSSPIKNFTYRLNLDELKIDDISQKFTVENAKNRYKSGKSSFKKMFFECC